MLFASSSKFYLRRFLIFFNICGVCLSIIVCLYVSDVAPLLSRENEHELCLSGRLSSNIIRRPTRSPNDRHLLGVFPKLSSQTTVKSQHSHVERELSHSHPQFPRTTLGTSGTMTPHLATKYNDDDERLAFFDSGLLTELWVKSAAYCKVWPDLEGWIC